MKGQTVLIVDDEEMILKSIRRTLLDEPLHVITAQSAAEALAILENSPIDLVVSDQNMPGMKGLDFLERIRSAYPSVLTILLTAYADIDIAVRAINDAGVYKFILKPWDETDFRITITRALEARALASERDRLMTRVNRQEAVLRELERRHPGLTKVNRDKDGFIISSV